MTLKSDNEGTDSRPLAEPTEEGPSADGNHVLDAFPNEVPIKTKIREIALSLLKAAPAGLRYKQFHRLVAEQLAGVSPNTIASELHTLRHMLPPGSVVKGHYRHPAGGSRGDD